MILAERRNRPCGCGSADKRNELPSLHGRPSRPRVHPSTLSTVHGGGKWRDLQMACIQKRPAPTVRLAAIAVGETRHRASRRFCRETAEYFLARRLQNGNYVSRLVISCSLHSRR